MGVSHPIYQVSYLAYANPCLGVSIVLSLTAIPIQSREVKHIPRRPSRKARIRKYDPQDQGQI